MSNGVIVRSPRIFERRRSVRLERARRRRRIAIAALLALAAGAGTWVMTGSSVFSIAAIDVEGERLTDAGTIVAASGLRIGASALAADLNEAAARVRALPDIREAAVERDGVNVRITVIERAPALEVRAGAERWILDADGTPLATEAEVAGIPSVLVTEPRSAARPLAARDAAALERLWDRLSARDRERAGSFLLDDGQLTFTVGTTHVRFGSLVQVDEKVAALRLVRREVGGRNLLSLDLRAPDRPAAGLR